MVQALADANWQADTTVQHKRIRSASPLPALTSSHRTRLSSTNAFRGLTQTFGPGVQPSLWNEDWDGMGRTFELTTPNHSHIQLKGGDANEHKVLRHYIAVELKPEGLKHTIALLDAYALQTRGDGQKVDARIRPRQVLERIGLGGKADDREELQKLMRTISYLRCTFITSEEKPESYRGKREKPLPYAPRRRSRRNRDRKLYTPLLVLESLKFGPDGITDIPEEVAFHLGAEFYETLFGHSLAYFEIPTALVLGYHAQNEQHELLLAMYLSSRVTLGSGGTSVFFPVLLEQSALQTLEGIQSGVHRTRAAARVLQALERLERDRLVVRLPHLEVDTYHATEHFLGNVNVLELAPATLERIEQGHFRSLHTLTKVELRALTKVELRARRRLALQRLLDSGSGGSTSALQFLPGPLLQEQGRKREAARQAARDRNERAKNANMTQVWANRGRQPPGIEAPKPRMM